MPNYFFTDADGSQWGPLTVERLQTLIDRGTITPTTPLKTDAGHTGLAGQIPGLKFNTAAPSPFAQAAYTVQHRPTLAMQAGMLAKNAGVGGILVWLLDFAFRDLRLPVINLLVCRIIYIICYIGAGLFVVATILFLFAALFAPEIDRNVYLGQAIPMVFVCCIGIPLFLIFVRLILEWQIILLDWITETKKASRLYIENNTRK